MRVAGYRKERALQQDGGGQGARAWARRVHDRDVGRRKLPRGARLILRLCVRCVRVCRPAGGSNGVGSREGQDYEVG